MPALVSGNSRSIIYYRDLILVLLAKEFKVRYKSTFMGYAWSLMHPLLLAGIFFLVGRIVMRTQVEAYALYLIAGLFPWQWVSNTCFGANSYFLGNASLIKKVRFQRSMLVLSSVLNESIHFICSLPVVVGFMIYFGKSPQWSWLWAVPLLLALQIVMMTGVGLAIATCNLFFRDLERLVSLFVQLLFYLTPIVYTADMIPAEYRWVLYANPFAGLILCWQGVFYGNGVPPVDLAIAASWTFALAGLGFAIYAKKVWRFAEIV
jgi:lipopolysaccharide transport system permease protein